MNKKNVYVSIEYACLWMHDAQLRHAPDVAAATLFQPGRASNTHTLSVNLLADTPSLQSTTLTCCRYASGSCDGSFEAYSRQKLNA